MKKRTAFVTAVYLFLVKDDKVFLTRRFNTGYEDGNFSTISGHVERKEQIDETMIREAKEEVGIDVKSQDLNLFHVLTRMSEIERIDIFYWATRWQGQPKICEPDLCDKIGWFEFNNLPENIVGYIQKVLKHYKQNKMYSKIDW
jgi:8-oxo-dGTP diphosphatase